MSAGQNMASGPATPTGNLTASSSTEVDPELRTTVVGMLANVLNGGFAELGYHPDHLEQVHKIYEWNARLRDENARLFADNRRLAQLIGMQNQRLTSPVQNGSANTIIHELQTRNQEIELSRQEILRQHEQATREVMILRAEVNRLSQILHSKGIPYEIDRASQNASSSRPMTQPMVQSHHLAQVARIRHSQLPPINTAFAAQSAQSAHGHQGRRQSATAHPNTAMYPPYAQPSISGRRGASGPTTPSMVHDQRELQRLQNEYAYPTSSSRPNTAPTVDMQKRVPVVDLTGEPDEDEDPRVAKKPRLASEPVSSAAEAMRVAGPSTPQPQRMTTNAQSFNGQVPLAANGRGYPSSVPPTWAMPHGNMPTSANEDVQMRSPVQQISQQVLTEVVQSAPPTNVQPTEAAQTLGQSEPVPSISVAMASMSVDVEHSAQATLNPSAEVVQQCIDENFVEEENEDEGEGGQERKEGSGKRWCRMCQLRYNKGLSDKAPEAFLVDATMEDLARHCQEEHPKGWVFLLQRCMEDQESDEDE